MKKITLSILLLVMIKAQSQNFEWVRQIEGGSGFAFVSTLITDLNGNIYLTGYFNGTVDFDTGSGVNNLTSNGDNDIFIQKLDQDGNFLWVKQIGGNGYDEVQSITIDNNGYIYLLGRFRETVDFDPGTGINNLTSNGDLDIFIEKLNQDGNFLWVKQIGSADSEFGTSITTDINNNLYISGSFHETIDFNPGNGINNMTSNGDSDIFILKLDDSGNFLWVKQIGGSDSNTFPSVTTDINGNVYLADEFKGIIDVDPGSEINNIVANGFSDFFIEKLDQDGNFLWVKVLTFDSGQVDANSIIIDSNGLINIGGSFFGTIDFDPGTGIHNLTSNGDLDIFIEKLDQDGNFLWAKQIDGSADNYLQGMITDSNNDIYITGGFQDTVDFNPGTEVVNLTANGLSDIYLEKLDASGNFLWVSQIGGSSTDAANCVTIDTNDNLHIVGAFSDTVDFNPDTETNNLTATGVFDGFVLKLRNPLLNAVDVTNNITNLYPNPNNGEFNLKYSNTNSKSIKIFDMTGKEIYSDYNSSTERFNLDLSSGIYFINIKLNTSNKVEMLKLIIE
ncbi:SBBP repeat-containing protein [Aquimarina sp. 2201CG5-10]|uniref:SBBP repeat-containing protein n=1 Tax=Aquimarina callyspongiae TaxID=3098150 RepID=UPI002AB515EE|nr:SBBP repeat-containing protein [Aquimarina sp. 2201CG5-10]MDY8135401.1 SBBP repeat-containing protein [Aquimarina sp. 2201CG5-10]